MATRSALFQLVVICGVEAKEEETEEERKWEERKYVLE